MGVSGNSSGFHANFALIYAFAENFRKWPPWPYVDTRNSTQQKRRGNKIVVNTSSRGGDGVYAMLVAQNTVAVMVASIATGMVSLKNSLNSFRPWTYWHR